MPAKAFILQVAAITALGAGLGLAINAASPKAILLARPVFPTSSSGSGMCAAGGAPGHGATAQPAVAKKPFLLFPTMSQKEAVNACEACTVGFVDARGAAAFASGHIPNAVHLPPEGELDEAETIQELRKYPTVVVYDSDAACTLASSVAERLQRAGFKDVRLLEGSWETWHTLGGPAQTGACKVCGMKKLLGGP